MRLTGGAEGDRTPDLVIANDALSQLSYGPVPVFASPAILIGERASARISEKRHGLQRRFCRRGRLLPERTRYLPPVAAGLGAIGCTTGCEVTPSVTGMTGTGRPVSGSITV